MMRSNSPSNSRALISVLLFFGALALDAASGTAAIIYSNDFETNTAGFNITDRTVLPSDAIGGTSTYLGRTTAATLTLTGLTPGTTYNLAFDVLISGTWDGSLVFGPDFFGVGSSSSGPLVNATFRNGFPIGNLTPSQTYSDATPLGDGGLFRTREGADVELGEPIYSFGRGAGNPFPAFVASGTTETLAFGASDFQGVTDETFALDNVLVSDEALLGAEPPDAVVIPEPSTLWLVLVAVPAVWIAARRRKRSG